MNETVLVVAAAATAAALVYPPLARWAWAAAAFAVAAWMALESGLLAGLPLILGVVVATAMERADAPVVPGFNNMIARLAVLGGALLVSILVAVRVLVLDLVDGAQAFTLLALGAAALLYVLVHGGPVEESRASRLAIVVGAAGWIAAGHPGVVVPLATSGILVLLAVTPRRLVTP